MRTRTGPNRVLLVAPLLLCGCALEEGARRYRLGIEGGIAWQSRNDVAIPGDSGTRFALDEVTGSGPFPAGRVTFDAELAPRHGLRAVVAPFTAEGDGTLSSPVEFDGQSFAAGVPTEAEYRFDSYRLTYRYLVHDGAAWDWRIGVTANVRDAEVRLAQAGVAARYTDTGFVPALHADVSWQAGERLRLTGDLDGLGAPQGRLIDLAVVAYWALHEEVEIGVGYRTIEGGADNDDVFTFAWIHQAIVTLGIRF